MRVCAMQERNSEVKERRLAVRMAADSADDDGRRRYDYNASAINTYTNK